MLAFASMTRVLKARPVLVRWRHPGLPRVDSFVGRRRLRRRPITTEAIGSAATHPSLRGALRRSNPGVTTCAAPATQTVVLRPRIGVGKAFGLPSLRTVQAVFPHTALQSMVS